MYRSTTTIIEVLIFKFISSDIPVTVLHNLFHYFKITIHAFIVIIRISLFSAAKDWLYEFYSIFQKINIAMYHTRTNLAL